MSKQKSIHSDLRIQIGSKRQYLNKLIKPSMDENRVWLVVKNKGTPVQQCIVIVEALEYFFRDGWSKAPNGYVREALKWDERDRSKTGKLDIKTKGSCVIEVLRARRYPNPHFIIKYHDKAVGNTHHLLGKYKLRVKIEARTKSNEDERGLEAVFYDIYFDYEGTLKIKVTEIEEVTLPHLA